MSYTAIVAKITVQSFPPYTNSKGKIEEIHSLALGSCLGNQVIISKEVTNGTLGVFFACDGQLSEEFCAKNDLLKRTDPVTGKQVGGMFEENRRVKSLKLKGQRSDGFWCPLSYFGYTGVDLNSLTEDMTFEIVNEHPICNKYYTKATWEAKKNKNASVVKRKVNHLFHEHVETDQFRNSINKIVPGSLLHFSEKQHGTSGRFGRLRDRKELTGWRFWLAKAANWIANKVGLEVDFKPYTYLNGSRHVTLEFRTNKNNAYYQQDGEGNDHFRFQATKDIYLNPGEMIYFELLGYTHNDKLVMSPQDITKIKDKSAEKRFGKEMRYTYGTKEGECLLRVYRITQMVDNGSEKGYEIELPWFQVTDRCKQLGLRTVPHIGTYLYDGNKQYLRQQVELLVNGESGTELIPSRSDPRHIQEGIVIRVEQPTGETIWCKHKSWAFGVLEGYVKDRSDYVDMEEAS